jgi:ubiquinone/menaquinone biosynthesis C-methylase UbiE
MDQTGYVPDSVGSHPQYDVFADEFLDHASDGFYNAHYDRPACLGLLGDVAGRTVLDAACGPGLYAEELTAAVQRWSASTRARGWRSCPGN